jgi:hypothetical protein
MAFTVIKTFVAKAPLDSVSQQMTKIIEWLAEDAGPMIPVKHKEGTDFLNGVKGDIAAKKVTKPLLKLGTDSGHLLIRVEGEKDYEKQVVIVKGYVDLKSERAKATVVNAHKGDAAIDSSSDRMAQAKGTSAQTAADVDLNKKGSTAPIIILAHGSPTSSLPGTVYATKFARKTPDQIIGFLVDDKRLDKDYAGIVYLDGCYTAAGPKEGRDETELTNFAKKVYEGLVKKGYKYLQVKGNLGRAATLADGTESVLDAQQEAELIPRRDALEKDYKALEASAKTVQDRVAKLEKVATALAAKHNGNAQTLAADVGIKLVKEEVDKLEVLRTAAAKKAADAKKEYDDLATKMRPRGEFRLDNLVGVFGPEKLASTPWYKQLFG